MADKKISQLTGASTPLVGTEVLPIVQSGSTVKVSVDNLTKGKTVNATTFDTDVAAAGVTLSGTTLSADGTDANIDINITPKGTGEVNITKVDIDSGAIDGTAIGANSASTGAFSTLSSTGTSSFATSSGNVGVGTASAVAKLDIRATSFTPSGANCAVLVEDRATWSQGLQFYLNNAGTFFSSRPSGGIGAANSNSLWMTGSCLLTEDPAASNGFTASATAAAVYKCGGGEHIWYTNSGLTAGNTFTQTERAKINTAGFFKASNNSTYQSSAGSWHEFNNNVQDELALQVLHRNATSPFGIDVRYTAAAPNGTGNPFLRCVDNASGETVRAAIRSNGGLANYQSNNADLSDARTKKDITPAASMWGKVAALEIVTYKYNDQTHDDVNLGVIAQQVESVEPVWVDADGFGETPEGEEPLKTVYTKDITFAAIKALQEAMARIEQLEAKVAALESK